jgi:uncharacterized protein (DUF1330 family)
VPASRPRRACLYAGASGYAIFLQDTSGSGYVEKAPPTIVESGGRPLVVHDDPDVLEGQSRGSRIVVLEFESVEAARNWSRSPRVSGGGAVSDTRRPTPTP